MDKKITQNAPQEQLQADTRQKSEKIIKKLIKKYEGTIFSFFRELRLPLKLRELVRAFILASGGKTVFEASHADLTNLLFKRSAIDFRANKETIRYHVKSLENWQKKKKIELIHIVKKGRKVNLPDGGFEYQKSLYELVLLDELVKVLYDCPDRELETRIKEVVAKMKTNYVPDEEKTKIPDSFMLQRDIKTLFTKFEKALEKAERMKLNPIIYGKRVLSDLQAALGEMAEQYTEKQNRERRISEFLASENQATTDTYENEGVEKHHINLLENSDGNVPSDNRMFPLPPDSEMDISTTLLNSKNAEQETDNQLLDAALNYAKAGYPVVPLQSVIINNDFVRCSCKDWQTCEKQGKHPRTWHGLLDATTNLETIRFWWRKWPYANIGLLTGKQSGIFVLDVDLKAGGEYSLNDLQDAYDALPATLTAMTGSGGRHLVFNYPNVKIKNSASLIAPGLDIKSDNGYIVAAPSQHKSGGRYEWHGVNTPIVDAPDWLIALILLAEEEAKQDSQVKSVSLDYATTLVSTEIIREGQEFDTVSGKSRGRHDYLFRYASGLVLSHSHERALAQVQAKNLARCVPPIEYAEVIKLVESAERYRPEQNQKAA